MTERFCTLLDCVDVGFIPDGILDDLPLPSRLGATRIGGVDVNTPRTRATLNAVLALAPAASGFTVKNLAGKVHTMTGHPGYTALQAAYDLRKLRGKHLIDKRGRSRHFHLPPPAARSIAGLLTLREQVIAPLLAGIRSPRPGRKPKTWTQFDHPLMPVICAARPLITVGPALASAPEFRLPPHPVDSFTAPSTRDVVDDKVSLSTIPNCTATTTSSQTSSPAQHAERSPQL